MHYIIINPLQRICYNERVKLYLDEGNIAVVTPLTFIDTYGNRYKGK